MDTTTDPLRHFGLSQMPHKLHRDAVAALDIGSARVQVKVWSSQTNGGFSLIEYEIPARTLVAPLHRHTWEDEFSFVLGGRMGAMLGDEVIHVDAGELVFKPRRLWHTVWNPDDAPCRVLELISPGGFEHFFEERAAALQRPEDRSAETGELGARYGVQSDFASVSRLCAEHGLDSAARRPR
jgi:mannose-6-phosphate isomerase-like protein (cupin superfamily)